MDRGNLNFIQTKLNERVYTLLCDPSSPLNEIRIALNDMIQELEILESNILKSQEKEEPEKADG